MIYYIIAGVVAFVMFVYFQPERKHDAEMNLEQVPEDFVMPPMFAMSDTVEVDWPWPEELPGYPV